MEQEKMTVQQVLRMSIEQLDGIRLPMSMHEEVGMPIAAAIHNMRLCIEALDAAARTPEPEEQEG